MYVQSHWKCGFTHCRFFNAESLVWLGGFMIWFDDLWSTRSPFRYSCIENFVLSVVNVNLIFFLHRREKRTVHSWELFVQNARSNAFSPFKSITHSDSWSISSGSIFCPPAVVHRRLAIFLNIARFCNRLSISRQREISFTYSVHATFYCVQCIFLRFGGNPQTRLSVPVRLRSK